MSGGERQGSVHPAVCCAIDTAPQPCSRGSLRQREREGEEGRRETSFNVMLKKHIDPDVTEPESVFL